MGPKNKSKGKSAGPSESSPSINNDNNNTQQQSQTTVPVEPSKPLNTQELPPREQSIFKSIITKFELKQYKKCKKLCDEILKKYPKHGETLAMKGLILNNMSSTATDRSTVYTYIKQGISYNIKSHICWHVYGIVYRSDHKYSDAIKCYTQALKLQPNNQQIQRDLCNLQLQCRQYDGYIELKRQQLIDNSKLRSNWLAYAIGNHLNMNINKAIQILDAYDATRISGIDTENINDKFQSAYDDNEYILYKSMLYECNKQYQVALQYLLTNEQKVMDKLYFKQKCGEFYIELQQYEQSEQLYRELLDINNDNYIYHTGLLKSTQLYDINNKYTTEQENKLIKLYTTLQSLYPSSSACHRLPLTYISHHNTAYNDMCGQYIRQRLTKGIPSLFNDLKPLYTDEDKVNVIQELIESYINNLQQYHKFYANDTTVEPPNTLLWAYVYAACHYDKLMNYALAFQYINKAIQHTPTLVDLYVHKARICKHTNNHVIAYEYMNYARELDTQDRYLNTKCVRYAWRSNNIVQAESIVQLFLRDTDGLQSLTELQVMWYQYSAMKQYYNNKLYNKSLKYAYQINQNFLDFLDDQNDFHQYVLRKMTLRSYVNMIQWADKIKQHRYYISAAKIIGDIYIQLYDQQQNGTFQANHNRSSIGHTVSNGTTRHTSDDNDADDDIDDSKPAETTNKQHNNQQQNQSIKKLHDDDPDGWNLYNRTTPLVEAQQFIDSLRIYSCDDIDSYILSIELYIRLNKPLLCIQSINSALIINPSHNKLHYTICKFVHHIQQQPHSNQMIQSMINQEINQLLNNQSLVEYNHNYAQQYGSSNITNKLSAAQTMILLNSNNYTSTAINLLLPYDQSITRTWSDALSVYTFIQQYDTQQAEQYKLSAHQHWPLVPEFGAESIDTSDLTNARAVFDSNINTANK